MKLFKQIFLVEFWSKMNVSNYIFSSCAGSLHNKKTPVFTACLLFALKCYFFRGIWWFCCTSLANYYHWATSTENVCKPSDPAISVLFLLALFPFVIDIQVHRWVRQGCWFKHHCYTSSSTYLLSFNAPLSLRQLEAIPTLGRANTQ